MALRSIFVCSGDCLTPNSWSIEPSGLMRKVTVRPLHARRTVCGGLLSTRVSLPHSGAKVIRRAVTCPPSELSSSVSSQVAASRRWVLVVCATLRLPPPNASNFSVESMLSSNSTRCPTAGCDFNSYFFAGSRGGAACLAGCEVGLEVAVRREVGCGQFAALLFAAGAAAHSTAAIAAQATVTPIACRCENIGPPYQLYRRARWTGCGC